MTAKLTTLYSWVNSIVCAVPVLQDYLLQTHGQSTFCPPFKFTDGHNVTCASLTNNLRALLHVCGLDSANFAPHSFCFSAATTAGAVGLPDWLIKVLGRWNSNAYQLISRPLKRLIL